MDLTVKQHEQTLYHYVRTEQFKARILNVRFMADLDCIDPTTRGLMSAMLRAKNKVYPTRRKLRQQLETMYDTVYSASVSRFGTKHVVDMTLIMIDERFTLEGTLLEEGVRFLRDALRQPLFESTTLEEEKQFLIDYFKAEYASKSRYAQKRFQHHLMQQHPYRGHAYGTIEAVAGVTLEAIEDAYKTMLQEDSVYVSYLGPEDPKEVHEQLTQALSLTSGQAKTPILYRHAFTPMASMKEAHPVTQQRWFTALKSDIYFQDDDYYAMLVTNTLLGEGGDSLLFKTVRDDHALAYYVGSSYSPFTGLVSITSGMDARNIPKVKELVARIIEDIQNGRFSDEDLMLAKTYLTGHYKKSYDAPGALIARALNASLFNLPFTENRFLKAITAVKREAVIRIASRLIPVFDFEFGGASGDDSIL
ncbi:MAG: insulinase family protein [Acholeplasmatales bacterium]|nr:MAG: insulinase family protein [Acholeplasmatales bacterium]